MCPENDSSIDFASWLVGRGQDQYRVIWRLVDETATELLSCEDLNLFSFIDS
jgi:hypothetical protein